MASIHCINTQYNTMQRGAVKFNPIYYYTFSIKKCQKNKIKVVKTKEWSMV